MEQKYFQRNLYSDGMLLDASAMENQQDYQNGKRQLVNRVLIGFGVACGFLVTRADGMLVVSAGLAVDADGRELFLPYDEKIYLSRLLGQSGAREGFWYLCAGREEIPAGEACVLPAEDGSHKKLPNRMEERCRFWLERELPARTLCIARLHLSGADGADGEALVTGLESPADGFIPALQKPGRHICSTGCFTIRTERENTGVYYIREQPHGLGAGNVSVTLTVEEKREGRISAFSGDTSLFGVPVRMAIQLFPERGTFSAAVKPERPGDVIRLRWHAVRPDQFRQRESPPPPGLIGLEPPSAVVEPLSRLRFAPVFADGSRDPALCAFSVRPQGGGNVDREGIYTAPDREGMFQVVASRAGNPSQTVCALVVVRGDSG